MNGFLDIYTIIFLVLAIVIFVRLRGVLGRRTGTERPPFDPYSAREADRGAADKVITLPTRTAPAGAGEEPSRPPAGAPADEGAPPSIAAEVVAADPSFDPGHFVTGARQAYEMIVTAFAEGDRKTLKQLLSREVYDGFISAIDQREQRQEKVEFNFVGIDKAEITAASVRNGFAQVTVRFVSSLISATKDKDGKVVDGDPGHVAEVTDIWTFGRETASRDPNWRLVATESVD